MKRFVFVCGPWQLLLLSSALKQAAATSRSRFEDVLVIHPLHDGPLAPPILEVMTRMAPAVWPWNRVVVLDHEAIRPQGDTSRSAEVLRDKLEAGARDVAELWLVSLWGRLDKLAAEAFPTSRLVLYEDGLHTYVPTEDHHLSLVKGLKKPRETYRALKLRLRERRRPGDLGLATMLPRHLARVAASYLWLSLKVPPADFQKRLPWIQLQTRFMKETMEQVSPLVADIPVERGNGRNAVVLGQAFSNYGDLTRDVELDCYIDMVGRLQGKGYDVIWKEHPRTRQPFLPDLLEAFPDVRAVPDLGPWPIELFVERMGLAACASLTSTALFSIPLLFGLPSFSPVGQFLGRFRYPNDVMARLVAAAVPPLDAEAAAAAPQAAGSRPEINSHA